MPEEDYGPIASAPPEPALSQEDRELIGRLAMQQQQAPAPVPQIGVQRLSGALGGLGGLLGTAAQKSQAKLQEEAGWTFDKEFKHKRTDHNFGNRPRFYRINHLIKGGDLDVVPECPIDQLRIKVYDWIYN